MLGGGEVLESGLGPPLLSMAGVLVAAGGSRPICILSAFQPLDAFPAHVFDRVGMEKGNHNRHGLATSLTGKGFHELPTVG